MNRLEKLQKAIKSEDIRLVKKLLKPGLFGLIKAIDVNEYFNVFLGRCTPILYAVEHRKYRIAEQLIHCGANVNHTDNNGNTSLILAAKYGSVDIVELLLANGADVNAINHYKDSAIIVSTNRNYTEKDNHNYEKIINLLISKGADVNTKNKNGLTPLLCAINKGDKRIAEILIKSGADIQQKDDNGRSLLQIAIISAYNEGSYFDIVKMLIKNGVDINACYTNGNSPIKQALTLDNNIVADWLIANGAIISQDEKESIALEKKQKVALTKLGYFCKTCGSYKNENEVEEYDYEQDEWVSIYYLNCSSCGGKITDENGNWKISRVKN